MDASAWGAAIRSRHVQGPHRLARPTVLRIGAVRWLAAAVALAVAAGGGTLALSGDDPAAPAQKTAAPSAPMQARSMRALGRLSGSAVTLSRYRDLEANMARSMRALGEQRATR